VGSRGGAPIAPGHVPRWARAGLRGTAVHTLPAVHSRGNRAAAAGRGLLRANGTARTWDGPRSGEAGAVATRSVERWAARSLGG
jgi:hypothetical protein